uniref:PRELI/MSF1 domain-containing protein n=1 Tax=Hanusia phi TaxID=3032 RepID=A0A7S0HCT3_9CRYP
MKFRWKERNLEIVAVNETGRSSVMYEEAVQFYPHPENSNWTVMRQCGSYEVDLFFGLETMGLDMCRSIFRMNFNNNVDADASMMQEYVSNKEVPGYFPTYLRDLFLQDTDPSLLPPLPPQDGKSQVTAASSQSKPTKSTPTLSDFGIKGEMNKEETARRLQWIFAPTPPLAKGNSVVEEKGKLNIPSRHGSKGAGFRCMQPNMAPLQTFATNEITGPTPPPLEIYGVTRESIAVEDGLQQRGSQGQGSSLVMF